MEERTSYQQYHERNFVSIYFLYLPSSNLPSELLANYISLYLPPLSSFLFNFELNY